MKIIKGTIDFNLKEDCAVSFGKFDGLHLGHKLLMSMLMKEKAKGLKAAIFSFEMHPSFLLDTVNGGILTTNEEKNMLFEQIGIDYIIEFPFTKETMNIEAEEFLQQTCSRLKARSIIVGKDFRFGYKRRGDIDLLANMSSKLNYELHVVDKVLYKGQEISSTLIRNKILEGDLNLANKLLGYHYFIIGDVVKGRQLGRTINVPTINIIPDKDKLLLPFGCYAAKVYIDNNVYDGVVNIGTNPTISEGNNETVEMHIFDFDKDVYGKKVKIEFVDYIRGQKKFESIEHLKEQILKDILKAKNILCS